MPPTQKPTPRQKGLIVLGIGIAALILAGAATYDAMDGKMLMRGRGIIRRDRDPGLFWTFAIGTAATGYAIGIGSVFVGVQTLRGRYDPDRKAPPRWYRRLQRQAPRRTDA